MQKHTAYPAGLWGLCLLALVLFAQLPLPVMAGGKQPPKVAEVIIVGDRVVDIAYNLGVLPQAMVARGGLWPMARELKSASQMLGCPNCVTKKKEIVPDALKSKKIGRVIIERNNEYCLYKPDLHPEDVVPLLSGLEVRIDYVDFNNGLEPATRQTGALFDKQEQAEALIAAYAKNIAQTQSMLPIKPLNKKVIILSGIYQPATGKSLLRVEAPKGYADRFLLTPLGCTNAGEAFNIEGNAPSKGHYLVKKTRKEFDLAPIVTANPDAIIATGDAFAVLKALEEYGIHHPELKKVNAVQNMAVYALPEYIDSSVIEYPDILRKWAVALGA